jgi:ATP-dependent DNA ligase
MPVNGELSFEALQLRLHPAASRIATLARESPASFIAFDLLVARGRPLLDLPLAGRRATLEQLFERIPHPDMLQLSPATRERAQAEQWLQQIGHGLDGIVAKRLDEPYRPGMRATRKFKLWQTVDCVVAGVYLKPGTQIIDSILLGLYDEAGPLHYVGRSTIRGDPEVSAKVKTAMGWGGFTGHAPAGRNRWSGRERKVVPVRPELVVEVEADHITDGHFRHGSRILRWRDDKRPDACKMDQLRRP